MRFGHHYGQFLEQHFLVVHWDQRGAGRSFSPDMKPDDVSLEQILSDAHQLVGLLQHRFPGNPVLLLGHSWGSIVGLTFASRHPSLICAYAGMGQFVNATANMKLSYGYVKAAVIKSGTEEMKTTLEAVGDPPFNQERFLRLIPLMVGSGGVLHAQNSFEKMGDILSKTPVKLTAAEGTGADALFSISALWSDIMGVKFDQSIKSLEVPVYFLMGRSDWNTPSVLAEQYLKQLDAPVKRAVWFEQSGHFPNLEEPEQFATALIDIKNTSCMKHPTRRRARPRDDFKTQGDR
jgi:pimeloyl-ACP methyl ester carboxylesterase